MLHAVCGVLLEKKLRSVMKIDEDIQLRTKSDDAKPKSDPKFGKAQVYNGRLLSRRYEDVTDKR